MSIEPPRRHLQERRCLGRTKQAVCRARCLLGFQGCSRHTMDEELSEKAHAEYFKFPEERWDGLGRQGSDSVWVLGESPKLGGHADRQSPESVGTALRAGRNLVNLGDLSRPLLKFP